MVLPGRDKFGRLVILGRFGKSKSLNNKQNGTRKLQSFLRFSAVHRNLRFSECGSKAECSRVLLVIC